MKLNGTRMMVIALVGVALLVGACGSKEIKKGMAPDWYLNPPEVAGKIFGTGASEKTASLELGKQVATANARSAVAQTVQVSVQGMVRTFLQQSGTMETSRALQFSESVSKQVYDVSLVGSKVNRLEERDGRMFALVEISEDSVRNSLLNALRDASAQLSEKKAKDAFNDLAKEVQNGRDIPIVRE